MTLDVSKLSGWLNADANCRVEREAHRKRGATFMRAGEAGEGVWGRRRKQRARRTRLWRLLAGARAERTIKLSYMVVTRDVSKLSGWLNAVAYCRVEREA